MWVVYIIATMGSATISGCLIPGGASMGAGEEESLCKQAITLLKPRGGVTCGMGLGDLGHDAVSNSACTACLHSSTLQC